MEDIIEKIRQFNRFYMPAMNLLGDHYLGSEYSVTQARIIFEIYQNEGCTAAHIARLMNIDKSYLSRIIRSHEKNGYLYREQSANDGRAMHLYLTEQGKARAEDFIRKSNQEIGTITEPLSDADKTQLTAALDTVMTILEKGSAVQ